MVIFLLTLFVLDIILLIPTILLQSSGADNGMLSSNITAGAFGAKSNEVLVKFTSYLVTLFIGIALILSIHFIRLDKAPSKTKSATQSKTTKKQIPQDSSSVSNSQ